MSLRLPIRSHIACDEKPISHSICACGPVDCAPNAVWSDFIGKAAIGLSQATVCAWFTNGQSNMWLLIAETGEMELIFNLYLAYLKFIWRVVARFSVSGSSAALESWPHDGMNGDNFTVMWCFFLGKSNDWNEINPRLLKRITVITAYEFRHFVMFLWTRRSC